MYEGCNKTALTSQSAIADALLNLMEEKPYTRISVSEICKSAGVSRQTFYTLFASKDNVIAYELERKYCFRPEYLSRLQLLHHGAPRHSRAPCPQ